MFEQETIVVRRVPAEPAVLHIEDDPLWAEVTGRLLESWPEVRHVGTAACGRDGLDRCRVLKPAVVVLDLILPDLEGFVVLERLNAMPRKPRILLLTCRTDEVLLHRLVSGEAAGLIWKESSFAEYLRTALATIVGGGSYFPPDVSRAIRQFRSSPSAFFKILSPCELSLLSHLASGKTDKDIAELTARNRGTVRNHWHIIAGKLGLQNRHDLRTWAEAKGFRPELRPSNPARTSVEQ